MSGLVRQKLSPSLCLREGRAEFLLIAATALDLRGEERTPPPSTPFLRPSSHRRFEKAILKASPPPLLSCPRPPASLSLLSFPSLPYQHGTIFVNKLRSRATEGGNLTDICSSTLFIRFGHTDSFKRQAQTNMLSLPNAFSHRRP